MNLDFLSNCDDYEVITDDAILYKINGGGVWKNGTFVFSIRE